MPGSGPDDLRAYPVLVVDDEPENLRVFELNFRRDFTILTAASGEEALEILNKQKVAVIVSDHRMAGMSGVEFLSRSRELDDRTIRILLTAYGDAETLSQAINDGSIYRFVPKPWQPDELRVTLRRAIERFAVDREREGLVRELGTINRIAETINRELSPDKLYDLLVGSLVELGFDGAALLLYDSGQERLSFERSLPEAQLGCVDLAGREVSAASAPGFLSAMLGGNVQTLRSEDVLDYEAPVRDWTTEVAAEEIIVAPIKGKEGLIGALAADNRSGSAALGAGERTLLAGVAAQAANAIQNARLVEDLRQTRLHVLRSDRLGTLGTLAAGLAHEINNPLVSIHTFLSLAAEKRHEDDPEFWDDYHSLASREVERIRNLVSTMSQLGRTSGDVGPREPCDLAEICAGVVKLTRRQAQAAGVGVALAPHGEQLAKVTASAEQLHQVFLNLVLNAIHSCEGGGEVVLALSTEGEADRPSSVCVSVSDTGHGIAEEDLEKIFDPFFTTRGPGAGTGLGLMISHRIVADHGGTIEVASRPGEGSTFRVRLPIPEA